MSTFTAIRCKKQSAFIEIQMTKERFRKTGGKQFLVPLRRGRHHALGGRRHRSGVCTETVPGFRGVVATHIDAGSIRLLASSSFHTSERLRWLMNAKESTSFS